MYNIKQKYHLKDYVLYFSGRRLDGTPCEQREGYINSISYSCKLDGTIELRYTISEFIGCTSGYCITQDSIIRRKKPKVADYGYKKFLQAKKKMCENKIKELEEEIKSTDKALENM